MGLDIRLYIEKCEETPWREKKWKSFEDTDKILNWGILELRKSQVQLPLFGYTGSILDFSNGAGELPLLNSNNGTLPSNKTKNKHYQELHELGHFHTYFTPKEYIDYYEKFKEQLDSNEFYIEFGKGRGYSYLIKDFIKELKKLEHYAPLDQFRIIYFMG